MYHDMSSASCIQMQYCYILFNRYTVILDKGLVDSFLYMSWL